MLGKNDGKRRRGWQKIRWLNGIIDSIGMSLSKLQETVKDREARCAAVHVVTRVRHSWMTALKQPLFSELQNICSFHPLSHHQLPDHHQLLAQTHVHQVSDAIQPSHPLLSPSPAFNLSQHQDLFQWVSSSHQVATSIGASASVFPINTLDWFPLGFFRRVYAPRFCLLTAEIWSGRH